MKIIPSLVENTPSDLFEVIRKLHPFYHHFQIDIEDGIFVSNKTLSLSDLFVSFLNLPPPISPMILDFHLMEQSYSKSLETISKIKEHVSVETVFIHTKLFPDLSLLRTSFPQISLGLAINPEENIKDVFSSLDILSVPAIQIMTVHPGVQGQPFIPEALNKIDQLRRVGFLGKIYLDGGINDQTIPLILSQKEKPDALCPGSFLAKTEYLEEHAKYLREALV